MISPAAHGAVYSTNPSSPQLPQNLVICKTSSPAKCLGPMTHPPLFNDYYTTPELSDHKYVCSSSENLHGFMCHKYKKELVSIFIWFIQLGFWIISFFNTKLAVNHADIEVHEWNLDACIKASHETSYLNVISYFS